MSLLLEVAGYFQAFSDGSIKRHERETAAASEDSSANGYKSKDVIISSAKPVSARIFLPDASGSSSGQLPVVVYFHGGGFCAGSTAWLGYHTFLGDLAVASQSIVLSVDYRLAPENRLPAAYDDCYSSLEWLSSRAAGSDPWLERADLSRVFLSGDSAGGNIVHHVALRAIQEQSCGEVKIKGLLPIHPFFGSEEWTEKEMGWKEDEQLVLTELLWKLSLPEGSNRDHPFCNFEKVESMSTREWSRFPRVVVYVAGLDFLKERGIMYAAFLQRKGVEAKLVDAEGENHCFHIHRPEAEATRVLQRQISEFIHSF